jgi:hypothetical protein
MYGPKDVMGKRNNKTVMVRIRINIGIAPLENKNTKGLKGQGRRGK